MPSVNFKVTVSGASTALNRLSGFRNKVKGLTARIMTQEAARANAEARLLVPLASGDLQRGTSIAYKGHYKIVAESSSVHNGYNYAYIQHENTEYYHANGRQDHYLSEPFERMIERIESRYGAEVRYD